MEQAMTQIAPRPRSYEEVADLLRHEYTLRRMLLDLAADIAATRLPPPIFYRGAGELQPIGDFLLPDELTREIQDNATQIHTLLLELRGLRSTLVS